MNGDGGGGDRDGEETITSTIYFDAKYEHIVEKRPPMPLYRDQALRLGEGDNDEIVKIFESGCIKHTIQSISYCQPNANGHGHGQRGRERGCGRGRKSPVGSGSGSGVGVVPPFHPQNYPRMTGSKSMADSSSDAEDDSVENCSSDRSRVRVQGNHVSCTNTDCSISNSNGANINCAQSYKADDGFPTQSLSSIPSPPSVSKSRQELDVISDWVFSSSTGAVSRDVNEDTYEENDRGETMPPSLKLMNNSSLSTQALTPTPSASDNNLSPKKDEYKYIEQYSDVAGSIAAEI